MERGGTDKRRAGNGNGRGGGESSGRIPLIAARSAREGSRNPQAEPHCLAVGKKRKKEKEKEKPPASPTHSRIHHGWAVQAGRAAAATMAFIPTLCMYVCMHFIFTFGLERERSPTASRVCMM